MKRPTVVVGVAVKGEVAEDIGAVSPQEWMGRGEHRLAAVPVCAQGLEIAFQGVALRGIDNGGTRARVIQIGRAHV